MTMPEVIKRFVAALAASKPDLVQRSFLFIWKYTPEEWIEAYKHRLDQALTGLGLESLETLTLRDMISWILTEQEDKLAKGLRRHLTKVGIHEAPSTAILVDALSDAFRATNTHARCFCKRRMDGLKRDRPHQYGQLVAQVGFYQHHTSCKLREKLLADIREILWRYGLTLR